MPGIIFRYAGYSQLFQPRPELSAQNDRDWRKMYVELRKKFRTASIQFVILVERQACVTNR